jgi:hypothetical protein
VEFWLLGVVKCLFFVCQEFLSESTQEILTKKRLFSQKTFTKTLFSPKIEGVNWACGW